MSGYIPWASSFQKNNRIRTVVFHAIPYHGLKRYKHSPKISLGNMQHVKNVEIRGGNIPSNNVWMYHIKDMLTAPIHNVKIQFSEWQSGHVQTLCRTLRSTHVSHISIGKLASLSHVSQICRACMDNPAIQHISLECMHIDNDNNMIHEYIDILKHWLKQSNLLSFSLTHGFQENRHSHIFKQHSLPYHIRTYIDKLCNAIRQSISIQNFQPWIINHTEKKMIGNALNGIRQTIYEKRKSSDIHKSKKTHGDDDFQIL
jgi:hypothetical protein